MKIESDEEKRIIKNILEVLERGCSFDFLSGGEREYIIHLLKSRSKSLKKE